MASRCDKDEDYDDNDEDYNNNDDNYDNNDEDYTLVASRSQMAPSVMMSRT